MDPHEKHFFGFLISDVEKCIYLADQQYCPFS